MLVMHIKVQHSIHKYYPQPNLEFASYFFMCVYNSYSTTHTNTPHTVTDMKLFGLLLLLCVGSWLLSSAHLTNAAALNCMTPGMNFNMHPFGYLCCT